MMAFALIYPCAVYLVRVLMELPEHKYTNSLLTYPYRAQVMGPDKARLSLLCSASYGGGLGFATRDLYFFSTTEDY